LCVGGAPPPDPNLWRLQECGEAIQTPTPVKPRNAGENCGERSFRPVEDAPYAVTSPGEFPWTCHVVDGQTDEFVATCAVIAADSRATLSGETDRVVTVAHRVHNRRNLRVLFGHYDLSGLSQLELGAPEERSVARTVVHRNFDDVRLNNNVAVLVLQR